MLGQTLYAIQLTGTGETMTDNSHHIVCTRRYICNHMYHWKEL